jgi:hypothetical protein
VKIASSRNLLLVTAASWAATSWSADIDTVPRIDIRAEQNDNFDLEPGGDAEDVQGYVADADVLFDIATPRGETLLRPRVRLQEYPDRDDFERVEAFFDVASQYRWERSSFDLNAELSRRDVYNTETLSGDFDPLDPGGGDDPEAGEVIVGETRTQLELRPTFEHRITQRASLGFGAEYQTAEYDADDEAPTKTDYDYGLAGGYVRWSLSPMSSVSAGAYASKYEADDGSRETDAVGGRLGYTYQWSPNDGVDATVFYERNETTEFVPVEVEETDSGIGGSLTAWRRFQVSELRLSVGRMFIPTGDRGKSEVDEFRLQYTRDLSQRLSLRGAARYESRNGISTADAGQDRDYARADLSLRWFMTPTWYLGGGYAYIWVDRELAVSDADNNKFYVNFGYQGRSRR